MKVLGERLDLLNVTTLGVIGQIANAHVFEHPLA